MSKLLTIVSLLTAATTSFFVLSMASTAHSQTRTSAAPTDETVLLAQARLPKLNLVIDGRCEGKAAVFKIRNLGQGWAQPVLFKVVGPNGLRVVAKRRMRLKEGQQSTFRVRHAGRYPEGVALKAEARWGDTSNLPVNKLRCGK